MDNYGNHDRRPPTRRTAQAPRQSERPRGASSARRPTSSAARPRSGAAPGRRTSAAQSRPANRRTTAAPARGRYGASARRRRSPLSSALSRLRSDRRLWLAAGGALIVIILIICIGRPAASPGPNATNIPDVPAETSAPAAENPAGTTQDFLQDDGGSSVGADSETEAEASVPALSRGMITCWQVLDGIPQTDQPLGLTECAQVEDSYFDGAVFVGDSVTMKLQQFVIESRKTYPTLLGDARFLTAGSLGVYNLLADIGKGSLHPNIGGQKMTLENALAELGAKKVYIMLGMNDVSHVGQDTSIANMNILLNNILARLPDIEIFIQSATPRYSGEKPTTQTLFEYDIRLYEEILKRDDPRVHFVDVAYVMRDEEGKLYESYCSDKEGMAMHFTNKACREWIRYLYTHAYI